MSRQPAPENKLRLIFFGTSSFARDVLSGLTERRFDVRAVVTTPDKPQGRGRRRGESPVKTYAGTNSSKLFTPKSLSDDDIIGTLKDQAPDLFIVVSYGKILPPVMLEIPRYGSLNIHASLLPYYRGPSPISQAIADGRAKTGVTVIEMNERMDAGDILDQKEIPIAPEETSETLSKKLSGLGTKALIGILRKIQDQGMARGVKQDESKATITRKIRKQDGRIDWKRPAPEIERMIRAHQPWPIAHTTFNGKTFRVFRGRIVARALHSGDSGAGAVVEAGSEGITVATGDGLICLTDVQLEGRARMSADAFLRGHKVKVGDLFS